MAEDARILTNFAGHPKTRRLEKRLGAEGAWALVKLILWVADSRSDGDLSGLNAEDLELAVRWAGEDGLFVKTLSEIGYLDGESGSYSIHDWAEHNPYAAGRSKRVERAKHAVGKRWEKTRTTKPYPENTAGNRDEQSSNTPAPPLPSTPKKPSAAKAATDTRFEPTRKFIERCCGHAKVPFLWGPGEAKQLSDWLKQAPAVDLEGVQQLVRNRFRSSEPPGRRPREWIPHLSSYAVGPVDRYGQTETLEAKEPNVNELREKQRREAVAAGG